MKIYGIANCNTVKKALDWLKSNDVKHEFHNFKKIGISESKLKEWADQLGWEALINKRGTTWKKLDPKIQQNINNERSAFALMQQNPSMIKRPVIESQHGILVGFDEELYRECFNR